MKLVHIVKRYGEVGGMERYVWKLTHHIAKRGHQVTVLCEEKFGECAAAINVIELGRTNPKPRWLSMLRFSRRVTKATQQQGWQDDPYTIIHSHERTAVHDFTTFHGPPIASVKSKALWWLSPRLLVWLWLERREVDRSNVTVLANSLQIQNELKGYYPSIGFGAIAWPAVDGRLPKSRNPAADVVFIGKEHQRKGLARLIAAMEHLRKTTPLTLAILGAQRDNALEQLLADRPWLICEPWVADLNPSQWGRVLVHPAYKEPYGMAVAEALASGIPAIATENCGVVSHNIGVISARESCSQLN